MIVVGLFLLDIMKQPAAILVLPVLYTILVLPVFYQNLPVSAILVQILVNTSIPVSAILEDTGHCQNMCIADTEDSGKYWLYQYCRYWKILENTGYTSIADTGRLGTKLRNVLVYCFFLSCLCVCYERTGCIGRPGERRLGAGERRRGGKRGKEGREKGKARWEK
jgi:hypothetical protein